MGVCLALEAKQRAEEEHTWIEAEEEARLAEESRYKAEEHKRAGLKVEEELCLALEAIRREEEEEQQQE